MSTQIKSALAERTTAMGGRLAEYSGVETAADFGDVDKEFVAITESCGVYDLGWRGKIAVTGDDQVRWLNGMVTNNIKDLALNHGNYNFVLNAQGRIQGDMYVYNRGDQLLIDTERGQVAPLLKILGNFIIMDDVELTDESEKLASIGLQGPRSTEMLKAVGIEPSCADPLVVCDVEWNGEKISIPRMANDDFLTYEFWLSPKAALSLWDALSAAGATPTGTAAVEKFRVVSGVPKYGTDIRDKHLPQETEQTHALNFSKGCYIGQEIVERIRSRANVHRTFTGFILDAPGQAGDKITAGDKDVGELTSVADVRLKGELRHLALGYVRKDAIAAGGVLKAGSAMARPSSLPFKF